MTSTESVIDELWRVGETMLNTDSGEKYLITYSRPSGFLDVIFTSSTESVGFITIKYEGGGIYSIVNDTSVNPHSSLLNTPGHGIKVKNKFRKRGLGAALLSIGIGIAQRDWHARGMEGNFKIVASDITNEGLGCYQNFGFTIQEGMSVSSGYYMDSEHVPEINILPGRVSFFKRLRKRLRL